MVRLCSRCLMMVFAMVVAWRLPILLRMLIVVVHVQLIVHSYNFSWHRRAVCAIEFRLFAVRRERGSALHREGLRSGRLKLVVRRGGLIPPAGAGPPTADMLASTIAMAVFVSPCLGLALAFVPLIASVWWAGSSGIRSGVFAVACAAVFECLARLFPDCWPWPFRNI